MMYEIFQHAQRETTIYTNGCYGEFEKLINDLLPVLGGIVVGIIGFEVSRALLSIIIIAGRPMITCHILHWYRS